MSPDEKAGEKKNFQGPLFVVGPPRSGTKLLRGILNASPDIGIGPESHLFPKLLDRFEGKDIREHKEAILHFLHSSHYWRVLRRQGIEVDPGPLFQECHTISEFAFEFLRKVVHQEHPKARIIGDKTPNYIGHMPLLKRHYPEAKFITIFRDPRDQVLSVKKTWNKPVALATEKWEREAEQWDRAREAFPGDLLTVRYEDLLASPRETSERICGFLGAPFHESMLQAESHEPFGEAKGMIGIQKSNTGKYQEKWSPRRIRLVEELSFNGLQKLEYPIHYATQGRRLSPPHRFLLKILDLTRTVLFHIRTKGVVRGMDYFLRMRKDKAKKLTKG